MLGCRHASHTGTGRLDSPGARRLIRRQAHLPSPSDTGSRAVQPRASAGRGCPAADRDLPAWAARGWVHGARRAILAAERCARSARPRWTRLPASSPRATVGVGRHRPAVGPPAASLAARSGIRGQRRRLVAAADRGVASAGRGRPRPGTCPGVGGLRRAGRYAGSIGRNRRPTARTGRWGGRSGHPGPDRTGHAMRVGVVPGMRDLRPTW